MAQLSSDLDEEIGHFFSQASTTRAECERPDRNCLGPSWRRQLAIYEMDRLPGDNYAMVRISLAEEPQNQLVTIYNLARSAETLYRLPLAPDQLTL